MRMPGFMFVIMALSAQAAFAQDPGRPGEVRLLPGHLLENGQYLAGVEISLAPGWKTYWRMPGEGGIPPVFDWSGSSNVSGATVEWPVPRVFDTYGLRSLGYYDLVVFPVLFDIDDAGADADLVLSLSYGLCSDICIPAEARAAIRAPLAEVRNADLLAEARAATTEAAEGISARCAIVPAAGAWRLDALVSGAGPLAPATVAVFEAPDPDLWIGTPDAVMQEDGLLFSAPMDWFGNGAFALSRADVRITLIDSGRSAVELTGC